MKRWHTYLAVMAMLILMNACSKSNPLDCFKNSGAVTTEVREAAPFTYLKVSNNVDVFLSYAPTYSIKVKAGKNILPGITTGLSGKTLSIANENSCNWIRSYESPIEVYLEAPQLDSILYQASGNITSLNQFHTDFLKLDVLEGAGSIKLWLDSHVAMFNLAYGTCDLNVRGYSHISHLYSAGYGPANLGLLNTEFTYITNNSTNNCHVRANLSLQVKIMNVGDVYYSGDPASLSTVITGEGHLYKE